MTNQILKSIIAPYPIWFDDAVASFGRLVEAHIEKLKIWDEHHAKVNSDLPRTERPAWENFYDKANPKEEFEKAIVEWTNENTARHDPYPRDEAHPQIEASIKTTKNEDGSVSYEPDFEVINDDPTPEQILSTKKTELLQRTAEIEQATISAIQGPIGKQRSITIREASILNKKEEDRSEEDVSFLLEQNNKRSRAEAISIKVAEIMSEIEDLTLETIDTFEIPTF